MKDEDIEKLANDALRELLEGKEVEVKLTFGECSILFTTLRVLLKDKTMPDEIRKKLVSVKEKVNLKNFDTRTLRDECISVLTDKVTKELMKDLELEKEDDKKERVLLNEDLKSVEEVRATLDELVDFLKKEIVRTRSADKLMEQNKHYEKLVISLGKLAVISKRWELYDYDTKD